MFALYQYYFIMIMIILSGLVEIWRSFVFVFVANGHSRPRSLEPSTDITAGMLSLLVGGYTVSVLLLALSVDVK